MSEVVRDVVGDDDGVAEVAPQPKTDEAAFWDHDIDHIAAGWMPFKGMKFQERTEQEKAEWDAFTWGVMLHIWDLVKQVAIERPIAPVVPEAPKPRKRVRVPKAAMPETDGAA